VVASTRGYRAENICPLCRTLEGEGHWIACECCGIGFHSACYFTRVTSVAERAAFAQHDAAIFVCHGCRS
jgi:hypothetical protein